MINEPDIKIWSFDRAPKELQELSENGGDEDWIAVLPGGAEIPMFLEEGGAFGCCTVEQHMHWSGFRVLIGCHA